MKSGNNSLDFMLRMLKDTVSRAGVQVAYGALLLLYAYKRPETSGWAKRIVLGTIAYVLAPIDAIPDLSPLFGFTDDVGVLLFGIVNIAGYINEEVKVAAKKQLGRWMHFEEADLIAFERKARI